MVVNGVAEVTKDEGSFVLHGSESVNLPPMAIHCLVNPGRIPLNLIELRSSSYLVEDDIERFDDIYGRD